MRTTQGEPQTAKEKMALEQKEHPEQDDSGSGKKWRRWRYQSDKKGECFYLVGSKCYKTENAACQAAHCKAPTKCTTEGAGPATMKCAKPE